MALRGPKPARGKEIRSAAELSHRVFWPGRPLREDRLPSPAPDEVREGLRVICDGERVVSALSVHLEPLRILGTPHLACCIGGVCTDPDWRGRGLATRLLEDARAWALARRADLVLISGSRGLYLRQGYVPVRAFCTARVPRKALPDGGAFRARPYEDEDLPALARIFSAEPTRFVRTPEVLAGLMRRRSLCVAPGETRVVCPADGGPPVAAVAFQTGPAPWERPVPAERVHVVEMAGPRLAIFDALGALLAERGLEELTVTYSAADREMAALAASLRWQVRPETFHGTVGIVAPERFWAACRPLLEEVLGRRGVPEISVRDGRTVLSLGGARFEVGGTDAFTRLVFEGPQGLEPAPPEPLGRLLEAALPLPLVNYGLTYY